MVKNFTTPQKNFFIVQAASLPFLLLIHCYPQFTRFFPKIQVRRPTFLKLFSLVICMKIEYNIETNEKKSAVFAAACLHFPRKDGIP
jgi:hypothetical protein